MSIPPAPASPDTPTIPGQAPAAPDTPINWEQRYNDLRPQFDRTSQEAANLRRQQEALQSDPDAQREFLAQLGYEIEEPPEPVYNDPTDALQAQLAAQAAELEQIKAWRDETTQSQTEQAQTAALTRAMDAQFAQLGEMDDETRHWISSRALGMDPREDGAPDIVGAHAAFKALVDQQTQAEIKAWREGKRPPRVSADGSAAEPAFDRDKATPAQLAEHMTQQVIARMVP